MTDRPFDIVLFGASGFTGELVAEYLAEQAPQVRWAIAGRSASKLEAVRDRLGQPDIPLLVADSEDAAALTAMVEQTRVIISTVGPYARYGTTLLEVCAEQGTHYCDLTGEAQWMAEVYDRVDPIAKRSGARLVHCCGFDSLPSDLSVYLLQKAFKERFGQYAECVTGRMGCYSGGVSGGTVASMMLVSEQIMKDPALRKRLMNPYALYPPGLKAGLDQPDQMGIAWDENFNSWTGPFVMAAINTKVVRRSNALAGLPYGESFRYDESQLCSGRLAALTSSIAIGAIMGSALFRPTRAILKRFLPDPGEGPDAQARENGFFEFWAHGSAGAEGEHSLRVKVTGKRDPGYGATSRMLAQAGLCLAQDDLAVEGGIWTPASALGDALIKRLAQVDVHFEVVESAL
jgi:short subunit dehydrogenase-like uncharacterized protein